MCVVYVNKSIFKKSNDGVKKKIIEKKRRRKKRRRKKKRKKKKKEKKGGGGERREKRKKPPITAINYIISVYYCIIYYSIKLESIIYIYCIGIIINHFPPFLF